jgi:hypothetical protein
MRPHPDGREQAPDARRRAERRRWLMRGVRYILPAIVVLGGVVVMAMGSESDLEGGASIISAGVAVYLLNWLLRLGVSGERERQAEDEARDYFSRYGRWPS